MSVLPQHQTTMLGIAYSPFAQPVSVLAPRSINVRPMPRPTSADGKQRHDQSKQIPFAQRRVKRAPLPSQTQLREARRQQHSNDVKGRRDDAQFERRTDDILRSDFLKQQREWQLHQAQLAQTHSTQDDQDTYDYDMPEDELQSRAELEQQVAEEQELQEMEALLALLPELEYCPDSILEVDQQSEHFGSDGDELEYLMDKIMDDHNCSSTGQQIPDEEMDLS